MKAVIDPALTSGLFDQPAEEVVAACAVASRHGARLAAARVTAGQFHDRRCGQLVDAAAACDLVDQDDRIHDCAIDAAQNAAWVTWIVEHRPVQWDTAGVYALRVAAAAARRAQTRALTDQLEQLGVEVELDEGWR